MAELESIFNHPDINRTIEFMQDTSRKFTALYLKIKRKESLTAEQVNWLIDVHNVFYPQLRDN